MTAAVAHATPSQAAVFDSSLNSARSAVELFEVFGTCEFVAPTSIVVIYRDATRLGSVNCEANGTFRMTITLIVGDNNLFARTSNVDGNYGPDSAPITVIYAPQSSVSPNTPKQEESQSSDLTITSPEPFSTLTDDNVSTIQVTVGGGSGPYTIAINWGDGSTETLVVPDPGTFSFRHTYVQGGIFKVVATVTDVLGVSKVYQFIVTSTSMPADLQEPADAKPAAHKGGIKWYVLAAGTVVLLAGILLICLTSFWLGRRYQYRKLRDRLVDDADLPVAKKGRS